MDLAPEPGRQFMPTRRGVLGPIDHEADRGSRRGPEGRPKGDGRDDGAHEPDSERPGCVTQPGSDRAGVRRDHDRRECGDERNGNQHDAR